LTEKCNGLWDFLVLYETSSLSHKTCPWWPPFSPSSLCSFSRKNLARSSESRGTALPRNAHQLWQHTRVGGPEILVHILYFCCVTHKMAVPLQALASKPKGLR